MPKRKVITVIGSGRDLHQRKSNEIGMLLARKGFDLLTGGGGGVMSAVSEAFYNVEDRVGITIGVIPASNKITNEPKKGYPNKWIELVISTHLDGQADYDGLTNTGLRSRNHINILSADFVIAFPGGKGTKAELDLCARYGKQTAAFSFWEHKIDPADWPVGSCMLFSRIEEVETHLM